jgi:hypothetical protein
LEAAVVALGHSVLDSVADSVVVVLLGIATAPNKLGMHLPIVAVPVCSTIFQSTIESMQILY